MYAQNAGEKAAPVVLRFDFVGLARTDRSVLEPYIRPYEGRPLSDFDERKFIQKLRSLGIFHAIDVEKDYDQTGNVIVRVRIEEKWTLIPVPLGGMSGDSLYGGLMILESNFLGYNKKFYGAGIVSNTGWKALFGYVDPGILGTEDTLYLGFNGERDSITNRDMNERVYRKYEIQGLKLTGEYGFRLSSSSILGMGMEFMERGTENYDSLFPRPDSVSLIGPLLSLRYQDLVYDRILVNGTSFIARYKRKIDMKAPDAGFDEVSLVAQYRKPVRKDLRYGFSAAALFSPYTPSIVEPEINNIMKSLPDGLTADSYVFGQAFLEYTFSEFNWGALTVLLAYEGGIYARDSSGPEFTNGPGLGFRVYVSKIAVPAFGMDFTYNVMTRVLYATINVGLQL